jgi:glycosyltransferase involved in cell wall biosynthesis
MIPSVSVVIPVYNRAATIKRALNSVLAQSFKDYEIVVVDDGSSDETVAIVRAEYSQALLICHPQNRGASAARNTGIKAARGRWIALLDSDDTWAPDKLARQVSLLEGAPSGIMASATGFYLHKGGKTEAVRIDFAPTQFRREIIFGCSISPGSTLVADRRVFDDIGLYDETMRRLEDWDWLLRYADRYDLAYIAEPVADVYLGTTGTAAASGQAAAVIDALERIRAKHMPRLKTWVRRRQLRSSLLIERASAVYRCGRPVRAAILVLRSFAVYPFRNAAFFRTLWRTF